MVKIVPNILSIFRICLVPVFVIAYFTDDNDIKYYAILVYFIAGLSDFLDGFIARKFNAQSKLGKLLDPLGDKLMAFTVLVCITITNTASRPFLISAALVFFIKEILMGIGGLVLHKKAHVELPPANFIGKASTIVFYAVFIALMLFNIPNFVVIILVSLAIGLSLIALAGYIYSYIKIMKSRSKITGENGEIECNQQSVQDVNEIRQ
ncbi:MAG: CDP-alcohol phosphatidyltransferase family protein [Oscillospiraceae bacterium]|nr:CDP-alcohol phosphatidyltransferase family protein [Oscillospiraceae bacterium]